MRLGKSPDLNPVEGLWACLKGTDLANHCCDTIEEVAEARAAGSERIRRSPDLLFSFLRKARLPMQGRH